MVLPGIDCIRLRTATFQADNIEAYGMGAGVLPVAMTPEGEFRVLLGRERYLPGWRGSCRWSAFEGSRKPDERLVDTALREFTEESLGVCDMANVRTSLANHGYWFRVVLSVRSPGVHIERYHATYVVPVVWDEALADRFRGRRAGLERVDRAMQEWRHARPSAFGDVDVGPVADGCALRALSDTGIVHTPWAREGESLRLSASGNSTLTARLNRWSVLRTRLERAVEAAGGHPAVRARRDAVWGHVQEVDVSRDHLEKDQVRWWSLPELEAALRGRGHVGTHRFRPYFLPVLQAALAQLRAVAM